MEGKKFFFLIIKEKVQMIFFFLIFPLYDIFFFPNIIKMKKEIKKEKRKRISK